MKIAVKEVKEGRYRGVLAVYVNKDYYGSTGRHWAKVLGSESSRVKYGKLYIDRGGGNSRRREALQGSWIVGKGDPADLDECPGAMFRPTNHIPSDVVACDRKSNQKLGADLGHALSKYRDLSEVIFFFLEHEFNALPGDLTHSDF